VSKQKETLGFNGFSSYYASIAQGYGGLNWGDVDYLNATYWQDEKTNWCDTGYQNVIKGAGEAVTWNTNGSTSYGLFESANLKESFTLNSMVAASAWETSQPFDFRTYTYKAHHGFILKASDTVYLSQTAQTLNFSKIGNPGDFKDIVAVEIVSGTGQYGNTCTYGRYGYTLGNEMALDNLKLTWDGKAPKGGKGAPVTTGLHLPGLGHGHGAHIVAANLVIGNLHHDGASPAALGGGSHFAAQGGFHSELLSLGDTRAADLTTQFHLPAAEHFGT
jgi:hypothetical protein